MSEIEAEGNPDLQITKEQAIEAFNVVGQAVNAAVLREFPVGLDNLEDQMIIKGALSVLKVLVVEYYNEPEIEEDAPVAEEPACETGN